MQQQGSSGYQSLEEVQKQFASRPLFDPDVSRQLDAMERRRAYSPSPYAPRGSSGGTPNLNYSSGAGAVGTESKFGARGYVLPPEIPRPASLQLFLQGAGWGPTQQQAPQPTLGATPVPIPSALLGPEHRSQQESAVPAEGLVHTPRAGADQGGTGRRRTPRRSWVRRHNVYEDEEEAARRGESLGHHRHEDAHSTGDEMDDVSSSVAARSRMTRQRDTPKQRTPAGSNTGDDDFNALNARSRDDTHWEVAGNEVRVDSQIERAALRSRIQQERMKKQGKDVGKVGLVDGGVQTDEVEDRRATSNGNTAGNSTPARNSRSPERRTVESGTQPEGYLLTPQVPYKPARPDPNADKKREGVDKFETPPVLPSTEAYVTAATTAPRPDDGNSALRPDQSLDAVRRFSSAASRSLMERLDEIQLANEEVLVKNKALAGDRGQYEDEKSKGAIARVAEANRKPPAAAAHVPVPIGGYGSVADRPAGQRPNQSSTVSFSSPSGQYSSESAGRTVGGDDDAFSPSRWQGAKLRNELEMLRKDTASSAADLRKWSTDLPGSTGINGRSSLRMESTPYNARKKWANVSFATPLEKAPGETTLNPMEELSSSARALLRPG